MISKICYDRIEYILYQQDFFLSVYVNDRSKKKFRRKSDSKNADGSIDSLEKTLRLQVYFFTFL